MRSSIPQASRGFTAGFSRGSTLLLSAANAQAQENPQRPKMSSVSHLSVYTTEPQKTEHFYVHDLGAIKGSDPQDPAGVRFYFNPLQFVEVLPLPKGERV